MRKVGIGHVYDIMESVADAGERLETVIRVLRLPPVVCLRNLRSCCGLRMVPCFRLSETLRKL